MVKSPDFFEHFRVQGPTHEFVEVEDWLRFPEFGGLHFTFTVFIEERTHLIWEFAFCLSDLSHTLVDEFQLPKIAFGFVRRYALGLGAPERFPLDCFPDEPLVQIVYVHFK